MKKQFISITLLLTTQYAYADGGVKAMGSFFEDLIYKSLIGAIIIIGVITLILWSRTPKKKD